MQFVEFAPWIEAYAVNYHLGVDGLSMWFVLLTAFITIIVVIAGWDSVKTRLPQYYGAFLILSGLMIGVFAAVDRSEEHTSELQSRGHLVCRLLLEKKKYSILD